MEDDDSSFEVLHTDGEREPVLIIKDVVVVVAVAARNEAPEDIGLVVCKLGIIAVVVPPLNPP